MRSLDHIKHPVKPSRQSGRRIFKTDEDLFREILAAMPIEVFASAPTPAIRKAALAQRGFYQIGVVVVSMAQDLELYYANVSQPAKDTCRDAEHCVRAMHWLARRHYDPKLRR